MFINGEWLDGERTFPVYNPATGELLAEVADASRADAARAIQAAHEAFAGWRQTTAYERAAILYRAYELMSLSLLVFCCFYGLIYAAFT